jgi:hypothetical protein
MVVSIFCDNVRITIIKNYESVYTFKSLAKDKINTGYSKRTDADT